MIDQPSKLKKNVKIGAKIKLKVLAFVGITASFKSNFKPSASGCKKPRKPTLFGPNRCCMKPITLRSARVKQATLINTGTAIVKNDKISSRPNIKKKNGKSNRLPQAGIEPTFFD